MVAVMLQSIFLTKEIPSSSAATLVMIIVSHLALFKLFEKLC